MSTVPAEIGSPPHSREAEQSLLGGLMLDPTAFAKVSDVVTAQDFFRPDHRNIFESIAGLAGNGEACDPVTVSEDLQRRGRLKEAGGLAYLGTLTRETPGAANVKAYAEIVRERAQRRALLAIGGELQRVEAMQVEELDALLERARSIAGELRAGKARIDFDGISLADMKPHLSDGYLVKNFIGAKTLVGIVGPSGCGKTFLTGDLAIHIASNTEWRGHRVAGGLVVYVALEGLASSENRFVAARDAGGFGAGLPLVLTPGPVNLRDPADVEKLIAFVRAAETEHGARAAAVIIDTLSRAMAGGDENSSEDMGALIAGADRLRLATGATVVLIHHSGKDESRGARGHSSLRAALDTEVEVAKTAGLSVATVTKQRDLPIGGRYAFTLEVVTLGHDGEGDPITTCVVRDAEAPADDGRKAPTGKNQAAMLAALQEWQRAHDGATNIASLDYRAIAKAQGISRQRLPEVTQALVKFGWLREAVGGFTLVSEDSP